MQDTPHNIKLRRVAASLLTRVGLLTLLTIIKPPSVTAYDCKAGYNNLNSVYQGRADSNTWCPIGYWNEGCGYGCDETYSGKSNAPPHYCQIGTYTTSIGWTTYNSCGTGQYSSSGANQCVSIVDGEQLTDFRAKPHPCPDGFYAKGASTSYKCVICPAGSYCPRATDWPSALGGNNVWSVKGRSYYSVVGPGQMINGNNLPSKPCASIG